MTANPVLSADQGGTHSHHSRERWRPGIRILLGPLPYSVDNQHAQCCTGVSTDGGKCSRPIASVLEILGKTEMHTRVTFCCLFKKIFFFKKKKAPSDRSLFWLVFNVPFFPHEKRNSKYKLCIYYFTFKLNSLGKGATHNSRPQQAIYYFGAFFSVLFCFTSHDGRIQLSYLKNKKTKTGTSSQL